MGTIKQIDGMDGNICTIYLFFLGETFFYQFSLLILGFCKRYLPTLDCYAIFN